MSNPFKDRTTESHPSFVTAQFSRISGAKRFFGSSVTSHSWIRLRVSPAELHHDLGSDKVYSSNRPLVEVDFSPAQFAELLTTMNVGCGTPGTLLRLDGKEIEQIKEDAIKTETHRVKEHFSQVMKRRAEELKTEMAELEELLGKPSIGKADRIRIGKLVNTITMLFSSSMPFYLDQFDEAAQRVASQAKAEVDAFITTAVQQTGLAALRAQFPQLEDKI